MDESTKITTSNLLQTAKKYLENNNYDDAIQFLTSLVNSALSNNSKMGVFIGEILQSSFIQLSMTINEYKINADELSTELSDLVDLIDKLISSIKSDDDKKIDELLKEIRFWATQKQYDIPTKYTKLTQFRRGLR